MSGAWSTNEINDTFLVCSDREEDDIDEFKDIRLVQQIPNSVVNLQSFSFKKKENDLVPNQTTSNSTKSILVNKNKNKIKKVFRNKKYIHNNKGFNLIMTSNTLTTNQNNNVMTSNGATLACKSNFTMDPSTLTKTSSNQDKHSTFKEIESPSFITDSSNHLNQSLGTEAVLNSGTLVRNLADVYNHPSKSLKKLPTDLIVDDDLQLGLALSASTQYKDEFLNGTHHNSLLDVTPVLEIDYNTGLLKYPSSHLKKKRIVTQILPVDKAKQIVLQEATDFLFSNQSSLASSSSPFLSIKPSSLPWIDSNSSFWKLSTTAPSPSLSTNNLHSFSSEYAQLRDMFITNSPLINVLNAKLSLFSSTSSHYLALKKKKEQIAAELHSILEETLDWAENLKFDLSSQDVFSQR